MRQLTIDLAKSTSQNSHSTLPTKPENASLRQALADRLALSEAIDAVGKMLSARGSGQPSDPRGYIGAISAALMQYPRQVALQCTDPLKGVLRDMHFLPEISDVIAWCEKATAAMRKPVEEEDRDARFAAERRQRAEEAKAWEEDRKNRPNIDELKAKHGDNWGIIQEQQDRANAADSARHMAEANERALLAEYAAAGIEPRRASDGTLLSLSLLQLLGDARP
jgi:hypothetical protein